MNYGAVLKYLREENELKQKDVADYLNLDSSQYCHYENESRTIPITHLNSLSVFYNVSLDYFFCFNKNKNYKQSRNDISMEISGKRLKEFRKEHKLTQSALALKLNTTFSTLSFYERGKFPIATHFLYQICKEYHISADYLLGKIDEPKYLN